jgi:hypothetical protein
VLVTISWGIAVFAILYVGAWLTLRGPRDSKGTYYYFDPRKERGKFEPHAERYQGIAKLLITLSTASVAFLINFLVSISPDRNLRSLHSLKLESIAAQVMGFLCLSILFAIFFVFLQSYFYEQYCHSQEQDTYRVWKYSLQVANGYSALAWFFFAYAYIAWHLM